MHWRDDGWIERTNGVVLWTRVCNFPSHIAFLVAFLPHCHLLHFFSLMSLTASPSNYGKKTLRYQGTAAALSEVDSFPPLCIAGQFLFNALNLFFWCAVAFLRPPLNLSSIVLYNTKWRFLLLLQSVWYNNIAMATGQWQGCVQDNVAVDVVARSFVIIYRTVGLGLWKVLIRLSINKFSAFSCQPHRRRSFLTTFLRVIAK